MSDEELTPRELEELEELAIQKGELEVEKAKTEAIKLQEVEKERQKLVRKASENTSKASLLRMHIAP